ncbi:MAG: hypothetical protein IPG94_02855 [Kineosporiaceae bacterium]|nr:hypothetical protein [Kineosporiaceae bacterium]
MLVAAAICPHPPLLLPGVTGAAVQLDPAAELRAACREAVAAVTDAAPDVLVVIAGQDHPAGSTPDAVPHREWDPAACDLGVERYTAGRVAGQRGTPRSPLRGGTPVLPLGLAVGQVLVDLAGWTGRRRLVSVPAAATVEHCLQLGRELAGVATRVGVVVLGDGSARRTIKAPGYLDPRAHDLDALCEKGLRGDLTVLRALDPGQCADLLVAGRAAWQVLAGLAEDAGPVACVVHHDADPHGVRYLVASWMVDGAALTSD